MLLSAELLSSFSRVLSAIYCRSVFCLLRFELAGVLELIQIRVCTAYNVGSFEL
jgi:hypothetical protein